MTTLWRPGKALNQPPHFGHVGHPDQPKSNPADLALSQAKNAQFESLEYRKKHSVHTPFDKGRKGTR